MSRLNPTEKFPLQVGKPLFSTQNGWWKISVPVIYADGSSEEVWYRSSEQPRFDSCDFILPLSLAPAMKNQFALHVPGQLSPFLIYNSKYIQEIFCAWDNKFSVVNISVGGSKQIQAPSLEKTACFFSGGIDSAYTLLNHIDDIDTIVFVHGLDIPLDNAPLRQTAEASVRTIAQVLGKHIITVETNLRDFSDAHVLWGKEYHGSALISIALLLSSQFNKIYIASSHTYKDLFPWGSHPLLDPLWSTESLRIVHDGCEMTRLGKTRFISKSKLLLDHLRVCWQNEPGLYNCCVCEKCLRTMIGLRTAGVLEMCRGFDRPLDLSLVEHIEVDHEYKRSYLEENLKFLQSFKTDPALERTLQRCLSGYWKNLFSWMITSVPKLSIRPKTMTLRV